MKELNQDELLKVLGGDDPVIDPQDPENGQIHDTIKGTIGNTR